MFKYLKICCILILTLCMSGVVFSQTCDIHGDSCDVVYDRFVSFVLSGVDETHTVDASIYKKGVPSHSLDLEMVDQVYTNVLPLMDSAVYIAEFVVEDEFGFQAIELFEFVYDGTSPAAPQVPYVAMYESTNDYIESIIVPEGSTLNVYENVNGELKMIFNDISSGQAIDVPLNDLEDGVHALHFEIENQGKKSRHIKRVIYVNVPRVESRATNVVMNDLDTYEVLLVHDAKQYALDKEILVTGTANGPGIVVVNGIEAYVDQEGTFMAYVLLNEGNTTIEVGSQYVDAIGYDTRGVLYYPELLQNTFIEYSQIHKFGTALALNISLLVPQKVFIWVNGEYAQSLSVSGKQSVTIAASLLKEGRNAIEIRSETGDVVAAHVYSDVEDPVITNHAFVLTPLFFNGFFTIEDDVGFDLSTVRVEVGGKTYMYEDGLGYDAGIFSFTHQFAGEGDHSFRVVVEDRLGALFSQDFSVIVDEEAIVLNRVILEDGVAYGNLWFLENTIQDIAMEAQVHPAFESFYIDGKEHIDYNVYRSKVVQLRSVEFTQQQGEFMFTMWDSNLNTQEYAIDYYVYDNEATLTIDQVIDTAQGWLVIGHKEGFVIKESVELNRYTPEWYGDYFQILLPKGRSQTLDVSGIDILGRSIRALGVSEAFRENDVLSVELDTQHNEVIKIGVNGERDHPIELQLRDEIPSLYFSDDIGYAADANPGWKYEEIIVTVPQEEFNTQEIFQTIDTAQISVGTNDRGETMVMVYDASAKVEAMEVRFNNSELDSRVCDEVQLSAYRNCRIITQENFSQNVIQVVVMYDEVDVEQSYRVELQAGVLPDFNRTENIQFAYQGLKSDNEYLTGRIATHNDVVKVFLQDPGSKVEYPCYFDRVSFVCNIPSNRPNVELVIVSNLGDGTTGGGGGGIIDTCDDLNNNSICDDTEDGCPDLDGDGVCEVCDDANNDGQCDETPDCPDVDGDGQCDETPNCPDVNDDGQCDTCLDVNNNDICDLEETCLDTNNNGICDSEEGCVDLNNNGICDIDEDGCPDLNSDGVCEVCPDVNNDGQCDETPDCPDVNNDGQCDEIPNCPDVDNDGQCDTCLDANNNGICDSEEGCVDLNNNGICDIDEDGCPDLNSDGVCEVCPDVNNDGQCDETPDCPDVNNDGQCDEIPNCPDVDNDGQCDTCLDVNNNGICDSEETCMDVNNNGICDDIEDGCPDLNSDGVCEVCTDANNDGQCDETPDCIDLNGDGQCDETPDCPDVDGDGQCDACLDTNNNDICDSEEGCVDADNDGQCDTCPQGQSRNVLTGECEDLPPLTCTPPSILENGQCVFRGDVETNITTGNLSLNNILVTGDYLFNFNGKLYTDRALFDVNGYLEEVVKVNNISVPAQVAVYVNNQEQAVLQDRGVGSVVFNVDMRDTVSELEDQELEVVVKARDALGNEVESNPISVFFERVFDAFVTNYN